MIKAFTNYYPFSMFQQWGCLFMHSTFVCLSPSLSVSLTNWLRRLPIQGHTRGKSCRLLSSFRGHSKIIESNTETETARRERNSLKFWQWQLEGSQHCFVVLLLLLLFYFCLEVMILIGNDVINLINILMRSTCLDCAWNQLTICILLKPSFLHRCISAY